MFIPLKITTEYSLLKSTIKVDDLVNFLKNNNIPAGAIVDTNLYGVMEFYQKMLKANLKPIIGLEININDKIIYLYAKNYEGYQNLLKIHTLKEFKELNIESLKKYLNNIKVVLPFISYDLVELFDDVYLGYQNDTEKIEALLKWEKVVYYKNACTLKKEDTFLLNYLEAMDKGQSVNLIVNDYSNNYLNLNIKDDDRESTINFIKDINIIFLRKKIIVLNMMKSRKV